MPTLLVWGAHDPLIPVAHGRRTAELLPNGRFTVRENAKHFPHVSDPDGFCLLLTEFVTGTEPTRPTLDHVAERLMAAVGQTHLKSGHPQTTARNGSVTRCRALPPVRVQSGRVTAKSAKTRL